jgi:hypothetical protein
MKLDATDMGRPLYAGLGFEDEGIVERWLNPAVKVSEAAQPGNAPNLPLDLDAAGFGANRGTLLRALRDEGPRAAGAAGYALGRPGANAAFLGPCVARSAAEASHLVQWVLLSYAGQPVYWDLLLDNPEAVAIAAGLGFEPKRRLVRMRLRGYDGAPEFRADNSLVFGIAGFEYG